MKTACWLAGCILIASLAGPARAQEAGLVAIASPLPGALVSGSVTIFGTAIHPQFQRYELAFGYDPNITDTWFSLQDSVAAPVDNDVLGQWDTSGLTDGVYVLRLRMYTSERDFVETVVRNILVQNAPPTLSPTPADTATSAPPDIGATATLAPGSAGGVIALPATSTPRPTPAPGGPAQSPVLPADAWIDASILTAAFMRGIQLTGALFILLATYFGLRALSRRRR